MAWRKVRVVIAVREARWNGFAEEEACVVKCTFKRGGVMSRWRSPRDSNTF